MRPAVGALCVLWTCIAPVTAHTQSAPRPRTTPDVWHPQLEHFAPAGTIQTEFGSALNADGYRKLRVALPWSTASERTDYYFDAYDGRQFLLRTGMPLKVRIKFKNDRPQWQVSRFVAKDRVKVGGLGVYVHTTESWDGDVGGPHVTALLEASEDFAARLADGGLPLRTAADAVESAWQKLRAATSLPGLMVVDHALAGRAYHFYPRKVTPAKARLRTTLPDFEGPAVTLMLGTEPEMDASGHPVVTYELEAEAAGPVTPAEAHAIAIAIGQLLQRAGLTARDQQEVESASNAYTLRQLGR